MPRERNVLICLGISRDLPRYVRLVDLYSTYSDKMPLKNHRVQIFAFVSQICTALSRRNEKSSVPHYFLLNEKGFFPYFSREFV